jgi:hypothetical protein
MVELLKTVDTEVGSSDASDTISEDSVIEVGKANVDVTCADDTGIVTGDETLAAATDKEEFPGIAPTEVVELKAVGKPVMATDACDSGREAEAEVKLPPVMLEVTNEYAEGMELAPAILLFEESVVAGIGGVTVGEMLRTNVVFKAER